MAPIDPLQGRTTEELIAIIWPAAEAWLNNQELLALQELLKRLKLAELAAMLKDPHP